MGETEMPLILDWNSMSQGFSAYALLLIHIGFPHGVHELLNLALLLIRSVRLALT